MHSYSTDKFDEITQYFDTRFLVDSESVDVGHWQSIDIGGQPEMITRELLNVVVDYRIRFDPAQDIKPNLPWADQHFEERVSGYPYNPPPSHKIWPHAQQSNDEFIEGGKFSHTYPERMWPRRTPEEKHWGHGDRFGIRFRYGDLDDVIELLIRYPRTRQAFLPIWFPEDTGAHHGERVPCSLGYQFIVRNRELECSYFIRSCDYRRHFRDDLYLAVRLAQWVANQISKALEDSQDSSVTAKRVIMHITSFHIFEGDLRLMQLQSSSEQSDTRFVNSIMKGLG